MKVTLRIRLGSAHEYSCRVCGTPMNPVERMLNATCGKCVRRLHAQAVGRRTNELSVRSVKRGYGRVKRGYRKHARPKLRTAARFTGRAATRGGQWLYRRL